MKIRLFTALALLFSINRAHADLFYTQKSTYNKILPSFSDGASKIFIKNDVTRVEMKIFGRPLVTLTQPDGSLIQVNPADKIYTVSGDEPQAKGGLVMVLAKVKKVGLEKLEGKMITHWHVDLTVPFAMVSPPRIAKMGVEVWSNTTPNPLRPKTQALAVNDIPVNIRGMLAGNIRVTGDLAGIRAAYAFLPQRIVTSINGIPIAVTETGHISHQKLPAGLFKTPSGYRKVSFAQWTKVMNDAIAKNTGSSPLSIKP